MDHFGYLNMLPVVKLPVDSHALLSLYQLFSHTCWILGKDYHSLYKLWQTDGCGRPGSYIFVFDWPTGLPGAIGLIWWPNGCVLKVYLTNPFSITNFIDVLKWVFLSFELITVNTINNTVNHKYPYRPSWSNLQILNSEFNFFIMNHKYLFPCTQKYVRDKRFPVICK